MTISAAARTRFGYWGHNVRRAGAFARAVIAPLQPGRAAATDGVLIGVAGVDAVLFSGATADSAITGATGSDA